MRFSVGKRTTNSRAAPTGRRKRPIPRQNDIHTIAPAYTPHSAKNSSYSPQPHQLKMDYVETNAFQPTETKPLQANRTMASFFVKHLA